MLSKQNPVVAVCSHAPPWAMCHKTTKLDLQWQAGAWQAQFRLLQKWGLVVEEAASRAGKFLVVGEKE